MNKEQMNIVIVGHVDGGSTLLADHLREREIAWGKGFVTQADRHSHNGHISKFIIFSGEDYNLVTRFAKELEKKLFSVGRQTFYLGLDNMLYGLGQDMGQTPADPIRMMGELARILTDSGQILITAISDIDDYDLETLKKLNAPAEILVVCIGQNPFSQYSVDLIISADNSKDTAMGRIDDLLRKKEVILEYYI